MTLASIALATVLAAAALAQDPKPHRVVGHGLVRFNGLGPERWARRYRLEHRRFVAEQAHMRRLSRRLRRVEMNAKARRLQVHETTTGSVAYWASKQINAAEQIGRAADAAGTDPWPNCPDPYDHGGASWNDTVRCENSGSWLDSPGYFRCGLQFKPSWETVYGRLCP